MAVAQLTIVLQKTGVSIMVTDDYVARNKVAAVRVSVKCLYGVLAEFPSITGD